MIARHYTILLIPDLSAPFLNGGTRNDGGAGDAYGEGDPKSKALPDD